MHLRESKKVQPFVDHVIKPCLGARDVFVTCNHVFVTCGHVVVTCVCDMWPFVCDMCL